MPDQDEMNYVVGRGRLYFNVFPDGNTFTGLGERYLGNTPALTTTQANTDLKHYSSESGLKILDRSVTLEKDTTGTFTTDHISPDNLAFWYAGTATPFNQEAASDATESFTVQPGLWYQIGVTDDNVMGAVNLASLTATATVAVAATGTLTFGGQPTGGTDTVTIGGDVISFVASAPSGAEVLVGGNAAGTAQNLKDYINAHSGTLNVTAAGASDVLTLTATTPGTGGNSITLAKSGTYPAVSGANMTGGSAGSAVALTDDDWTTDLPNGRFMIADDGGVLANSVVAVTYDTNEQVGSVIVTAKSELYGELRFISDNPVGANTDYFWPYVKLVSDGDYALKGDDWQQMQFSFDVLKRSNRESVYARQKSS